MSYIIHHSTRTYTDLYYIDYKLRIDCYDIL